VASNHRRAERSDEGSGLIDIAALADVKSETRLAAIDPLNTPAWDGGPVRRRDHRLLIAILGGICLASVGVVGLALWVKVQRAESAGGLERAAGAAPAAREGVEPSASPAPARVPEVVAAVDVPRGDPPPPPAASAAEDQSAREPAPAKADDGAKSGATAVADEKDTARETRREQRQRRRKERASSLPDKPTREQVLRALGPVQTRVKRCARGQRGVVTLDLRINGPRGRVASAEVSGVSGDAKRCVASAARGARFPRFADERFAIRYPIKL
jgi:hypothetical protein